MIEHPVYHGLMGMLTFVFGKKRKAFKKRLVSCLMGVFLEGSLVPFRIARGMVVLYQDSVDLESHQRNLYRFLNHSSFDWHRCYLPLFRKLTDFEKVSTVYLCIDETSRRGDFRTLVAAFCCGGRAVPVAWETWRAQLKTSIGYWTRLYRVLAKARKVVCKNVEVIVIGDRAFGNTPFIDLVESFGWKWVARLQKQTCFQWSQGHSKQLFHFFTQPGKYKAKGKMFKKAGWREASLVCWWESKYKEALLLASNLPPSWEMVEIYRKRSLIECLSRDWKAKGFQWESCQIQHFDRHNRLFS